MKKIRLTILALSFVMLLFGRAAWAGGWVKLLGTSGVAYDMALDSNGNIYITGYVGDNIFIAKYDGSGKEQWTKLLGTSGNELGRSIAVDSSGTAYVTGYTSGDLDGNANTGLRDIFIAKYDTDGTKQWIMLFGTSEDERGRGITVDSSGSIYVTGDTCGELDGETNAGGADIFVLKCDTSGTWEWTELLGTSADDRGYDIIADSMGNIYVTGETYGNLGGHTNEGARDIFIAKYNNNGILQWTELFGTLGDEYGHGIATDSGSTIYITGYTQGNLDGNTNAGGDDIFIAKYENDGTRLWTELLGTSGREHAHQIVADLSGYIYITGLTSEDIDGNTNAGGEDILVSKYDNNGNKQWTELLGNSADDVGRSIAVDSSGNICVTGEIGDDIFIWKLAIQDDILQILQGATDTIIALEESVLKNQNMMTALINKFNAALEKVNEGLYQDALNKLVHDILTKTNGCTEIGSADKNDWIRDCEAQSQVYPLIMEAIELLMDLI